MGDVLVSIIIPTFNREELLSSCLDAVSKMEFPHGKVEVIVVNDGGNRDLAEIINHFESGSKENRKENWDFKSISQKNAGPAKARNTGAEHAQGEFLAFIDDDCRPSENWLSELYKVLQHKPNTLVGGRTINGLSANLFSESSQLLIDFLYSYYNSEKANSKFFTSNNMAISTSLFKEIGGFDVTTLKATAEDREICDRLAFKGKKLEYVQSAAVHHFHDLSFSSLWRQHFNYGKGAFYFRKVRALRGQESLKVEPFSFYRDLIMFPLKEGCRKPIRLSLLMIYIQAANVLGFFYESLLGNSLESRS